MKTRARIDESKQKVWAPSRGDQPHNGRKWEGAYKVKPWEYACEAVIPVLDTPDTLPYVIELLRLQTARPYIVIIDTGSSEENFKLIEEMRAPDVEVHSLRFNGVRHPSDFPAIAMDLAMSMCRTEHLFCTHADVFLKQKNLLEEMIKVTGKLCPAIGYQMTPRDHPGWERMVSHTATMLHMPTMDKIGAGWNLRRLCNNREVQHIPNILGNNWPDTEILINYILWENGLQASLIGKEQNHARTNDGRIDHCRTITAGRLYSKDYADKAQVWLDDAIEKAKERIEQWTQGN
jgi:hypothetical protein